MLEEFSGFGRFHMVFVFSALGNDAACINIRALTASRQASDQSSIIAETG
jgi:hypothetical protein